MTSRTDALGTIVSLARAHDLSVQDIATALDRQSRAAAARAEDASGSTIVRIMAYIGGLLVFAGLGFYISMVWDSLSPLARVIITLGPGLAALGLGVACLKDGRYEKAATPLFLMAAALQPTGLLVWLHEYFPPSDAPELAVGLVFSILGIQQAVLFKTFNRTSLALFTILFGFSGISSLLYWLNADMALVGTVLSFAGLCLTGEIAKTEHKILAPFLFLLFGGGLLAAAETSLYTVPQSWFAVLLGAVLLAVSLAASLSAFIKPRPLIVFLAVAGTMGFFGQALNKLGLSESLNGIAIGACALMIAYGLKDGLQEKASNALGVIFGFLFAWGWYDLLENTSMDILLVGIGAAMMYGSVVIRSRVFLGVSVVSLLGYLGHITDKYFANAVGWPIALMVLGLALILISAYAVKLSKRIRDTA